MSQYSRAIPACVLVLVGCGNLGDQSGSNGSKLDAAAQRGVDASPPLCETLEHIDCGNSPEADGSVAPNGDGETSDSGRVPSSACGELDRDDCEATSGCWGLSAMFDTSEGERVEFVACSGEEECGGAESCASDGDGGPTLRFPSTCIPEGWSLTECQW